MVRKRFIAGAVCPSCGQMDTLQVYTTPSGQKVMTCVDCNFLEQLTSHLALEGELPETRISREEKILDNEVDIVRILPD